MIRMLALLACLGACARTERPEVAFLLATLHDERYQKDVRHFEGHADDLGLRVVTLAADNDHDRQRAQVDEMLDRGIKVLVIQPADSHAAADFVTLAHERGARVVAYDRAIDHAALDYYVTHDSYRIGVLQAEAALAATGGAGNYVVLSGEAGHSVATEITRGYQDTLAPYVASGKLDVVLARDHAAWSAEQAARTVAEALQQTRGDIDAILANNSGMARGAVQALAGTGASGVFIAGADADTTNLTLVCQGKQSLEIHKDIRALAETAADVARQLADGKRPEATTSVAISGVDVPASSLRVVPITSEQACKNRIAAAK